VAKLKQIKNATLSALGIRFAGYGGIWNLWYAYSHL